MIAFTLRSNTADWDQMSMEKKLSLDQEAASRIDKLMVAVEAYPEVRSQQNFLHLQRSLNEAEAQISAARRTYNATVTSYNDNVQMFPQNIVAGFMNLQPKNVFQASATERQNVDVANMFDSRA
ncbi:MAG: LemA family protein [Cyclobacteriaceae bacterium]